MIKRSDVIENKFSVQYQGQVIIDRSNAIISKQAD
jgi:hypothetical protein